MPKPKLKKPLTLWDSPHTYADAITEEITPQTLAQLRYRWRYNSMSLTVSNVIRKLIDALAEAKGWDLKQVEWEDAEGKKYRGMEPIEAR